MLYDTVFDLCLELEIVVWDSAKDVGFDLFGACCNLRTVIFGDDLRNLCETAFFGCVNLESLYIGPQITEFIPSKPLDPKNPFSDCDNLTIYGQAGSYIETFCAENGIPFVAK